MRSRTPATLERTAERPFAAAPWLGIVLTTQAGLTCSVLVPRYKHMALIAANGTLRPDASHLSAILAEGGHLHLNKYMLRVAVNRACRARAGHLAAILTDEVSHRCVMRGDA
ncbi:MAG: hypothetical protein FJ147_26815 [Deltaproteobacteria bacterium]|nr:hypothetical protein [Deltaproteobacteria bacterium]